MNKLVEIYNDLDIIINYAKYGIFDKISVKYLEKIQRDIMEFNEMIPDIQDASVSKFCAGVHTVHAGLSTVVYKDCPEEWTEKVFANIVYDYDHGDTSVGIMPTYGWILAPNQEGTIIEELVKKRS